MVETNEKTGSSFMVRVSQSNESDEVRKELKKLLYTTCNSLPDLRLRRDVFNLYPFRKEVVLNQGKLAEARLASDILTTNKKYSYVRQLLMKLRNSYKRRTLLEDFGVSNLEDLEFLDAVNALFKESNNVISLSIRGVTVQIECKDYTEFKNLRKLKLSSDHFHKILHDVGSTTYIPILFSTEDYIEFEKGHSLISFRLDSSSEKRTMLETALFRNIQSLLVDNDAEIVNYSTAMSFSIFDILCRNDEVSTVMNVFSDVYRNFENLAIERNFNLDFGIKRNVGQKDCVEERYYLLSGDYYNDLKSRFKFKDKKYLGFDLYFL